MPHITNYRSSRAGSLISNTRLAMNFNQQDVARLADTTAATVGHYERMTSDPIAWTPGLRRIAHALDIEAEMQHIILGTPLRVPEIREIRNPQIVPEPTLPVVAQITPQALDDLRKELQLTTAIVEATGFLTLNFNASGFEEIKTFMVAVDHWQRHTKRGPYGNNHSIPPEGPAQAE